MPSATIKLFPDHGDPSVRAEQSCPGGLKVFQPAPEGIVAGTRNALKLHRGAQTSRHTVLDAPSERFDLARWAVGAIILCPPLLGGLPVHRLPSICAHVFVLEENIVSPQAIFPARYGRSMGSRL